MFARLWITVLLAASALNAQAQTHYTLQPLPDSADVAWSECLGEGGDAAARQAFLHQARKAQLTESVHEYSTKDKGAVLAIAGRWVCVPFSSAGNPRWPAEALLARLRFEGVDAEAELAFAQALMTELARSGRATGTAKFSNGNALEVSVFATPYKAAQMLVATAFLKAETYRPDPNAIQLDGTKLKSLQIIRRDTGSDWFLPMRQATLRHPVDGEFVVVPGTPATQALTLGGTRWSSSDGRLALSFLDNGLVTVHDGKALESGSWLLAEGVLRLQMHDGRRYSLVLDADDGSLHGVMRRTLKSDLSKQLGDPEGRAFPRFKRSP